MSKRILVVGAGLYGATCARMLADDGHDVVVMEKKDHVGGHCHTNWVASAGCYQHVYGPHVFHTNDRKVWDFVNAFAEFNGFINRPKVFHKGRIYSFPINLLTLYQLWGVTTPEHARQRVAQECATADTEPDSLEKWCLMHMGRTLYETFVEGYSEKQWGRHPRELPASIIKRLPIRFNYDDNYYDHEFQGVPRIGYTKLIEAILDTPNLAVELGVYFRAERERWPNVYDIVIYTGAIDEFFGYAFGPLEYRSLQFETKLLPVEDFQGNAIINYTDRDVSFTRVVEHKHFDPQRESCGFTVVTYEYPLEWRTGMDCFYPVGTKPNLERLKLYQERAARDYPKVHFGGRLGTYSYLDMDQTVSAAMKYVESLQE